MRKWQIAFGFLITCTTSSLFAQGEGGEAGEKKDAAPAVEKADNKGVDRLFPKKEFYTREEVEALQKVLKAKSSELDQDIETQKAYIESLKSQVAEHLTKIEGARKEIAEFMNARDEKEEAKLKKLARFYEAMEAEAAAPLLKRVQDDLMIKIFDRMDTKKAGAILAQFPANRAARITSSFPKLKLQADSLRKERRQ